MVWGFIPADPLSGEEKYYIFTKGTFKVGRKGCDVIIHKDKGASRIHAEIVVDEMISFSPLKNKSSKVRIRDCSKYGTYIQRNLGLKDKIHEFPDKETTLNNGDLVTFGTGNATYRFCFVPLVFLICCSESFQVNHSLKEKFSSIGARTSYHFSQECTHVLVDHLTEVKEDLFDAIVAKTPFVLSSWVEFVAGKSIRTEIPSCISYVPALTVEGQSVKIADPKTRENCLEGYSFLLESTDMYKFGHRLRSLLEVAGSKILSIEGFCSSSQGSEYGENNRVLFVIPGAAADKSECLNKFNSLSRVKELDLICAVLSGHLDPSILISPPVLVVSSSCSTDETIVADSDTEAETATSVHATAAVLPEATIYQGKVELPTDCAATNLESSLAVSYRHSNDDMIARADKVDASESGNSDVIYSQELIVRHINSPTKVAFTADTEVINFKSFKKTNTQSGNSFNNLIPFSKFPYKDSGYGSEEVVESVKEEKKRKQMEAIAEDLFNNDKSRRRGIAGSLHGLLTRG